MYQIHPRFAGGSKKKKKNSDLVAERLRGYEQEFIHVNKERGIGVKVMIFSLNTFELILNQFLQFRPWST